MNETAARTPRTAHFDPISGASGDMILGALLDAGAPLEEVRRLLATLPLPPFRLEAKETRVQGFRATRVTIEVPHEHVHRHLSHIEKILREGALPERARENAIRVFRCLAEAEGRVHGIAPEKVHFHEVGALDSILDIAGSAIALDLLDIETVTFSTLHDGSGTARTAHGEVPVPVPAVLELTNGLPLVRVDVPGELLTPTGAAFLTTLGRFTPATTLVAERVGVACGSKEIPGRPNLLRVTLAKAAAAATVPWWDSDEVVVLEANVDDLTPEALGYVLDRAVTAGAIDAFIVPCTMKKGRPGHLVALLASPENADRATAFLLRETSTFGVRRSRSDRAILRRASAEVSTPWGPVRVKIGSLGEGRPRLTVEFESCREIAERTGQPLHEVEREIQSHVRFSEATLAELALRLRS